MVWKMIPKAITGAQQEGAFCQQKVVIVSKALSQGCMAN